MKNNLFVNYLKRFDKIDDGDGVLSTKELLQYEADHKKKIAIYYFVLAGLNVITATKAKGLANKILAGLAGIAATCFTISGGMYIDKANKLKTMAQNA